MCAPAVALGAVSAASGVASAVGQHQSAQAQADAANASTRRQFRDMEKQRTSAWERDSLRYNYQKLQYEQQVNENNTAANDAYMSAQVKLNEQFKRASFDTQAQMIDLMNKQGMSAAAGQAGRSVDRLDNNLLAAFGRNQSIQAASLLSARNAYTTQTDQIRKQLVSDNRRAFSPVAMQPVAGVAPSQPIMASGPSGLGLIAGIGSAAVGGYDTYNSLKAPLTGLPRL